MFAGEHSSSYMHVLYHVGMTVLCLAASYTVIMVLFGPLLRKGGRGMGRRRRQSSAATPRTENGKAQAWLLTARDAWI